MTGRPGRRKISRRISTLGSAQFLGRQAPRSFISPLKKKAYLRFTKFLLITRDRPERRLLKDLMTISLSPLTESSCCLVGCRSANRGACMWPVGFRRAFLDARKEAAAAFALATIQRRFLI